MSVIQDHLTFILLLQPVC